MIKNWRPVLDYKQTSNSAVSKLLNDADLDPGHAAPDVPHVDAC